MYVVLHTSVYCSKRPHVQGKSKELVDKKKNNMEKINETVEIEETSKIRDVRVWL